MKRWSITSDGTAVNTHVYCDGHEVDVVYLQFSIRPAETACVDLQIRLWGGDVDVNLDIMENDEPRSSDTNVSADAQTGDADKPAGELDRAHNSRRRRGRCGLI